MEHSRRLAVVVVGMHRSGTSAVAGTAVRLGLAPPRRPLPAAPDNPTGFYEPASVAIVNHELMRSLGHSWHDSLSFLPGRLDHDTFSSAWLPLMTGALEAEFENDAAFVMKDPRLSLTLPFWLPALRSVGAAVAVLLVIRHPAEVARSLLWRDRLAEAVTVPLWLHHVLEAERMSRALPRALVFYDDLLRDWRGCMERAGQIAGIAWPASMHRAATDIDTFLNRANRHHFASDASASIGPPVVRDIVGSTWQALRQLRDNAMPHLAQEMLGRSHARFADWKDQLTGGSPAAFTTTPAEFGMAVPFRAGGR